MSNVSSLKSMWNTKQACIFLAQIKGLLFHRTVYSCPGKDINWKEITYNSIFTISVIR
jgi:hypothetical protein